MKKFAILSFFLIYTTSPLLAEVQKNRFALGANVAGGEIRYFLTQKIPLAAKVQFQDDVLVAGMRQSYYFNPSVNKLYLFTGLEEDYVTFKENTSEGAGFAIQAFGGAEYFVFKNFSFQFDLGPTWLFLDDDSTSESENGIDLVLNLGVNWYFGKGSP